ncbi:MAG TPA: pyridoxamine 5'-phosphate oxidase [Gammaproteobacteria bacterium]|jgi:hypothetical protein|nr:pyridoxamine 5'-phosphate oxidase [Gammaproteobacteria bacterium]
MQIQTHWGAIKRLFRDSFSTSFHYAIATVTREGEPHVTPIGSLILGQPGQGVYFEQFTQHLPQNITVNDRVCVLAVNSSRWFWLKSLIGGRFASPPAVRLYGVAKARREATEREIARWQKRIKPVRFTRGHERMWRDMRTVRDIEFDRVEPVQIGEMTRGLWGDHKVAV